MFQGQGPRGYSLRRWLAPGWKAPACRPGPARVSYSLTERYTRRGAGLRKGAARLLCLHSFCRDSFGVSSSRGKGWGGRSVGLALGLK